MRAWWAGPLIFCIITIEGDFPDSDDQRNWIEFGCVLFSFAVSFWVVLLSL